MRNSNGLLNCNVDENHDERQVGGAKRVKKQLVSDSHLTATTICRERERLTNATYRVNHDDLVPRHQLKQTETNFFRLNGSNTMTGDWNLNSNKLILPAEIDMDRKRKAILDDPVNDLGSVSLRTFENRTQCFIKEGNEINTGGKRNVDMADATDWNDVIYLNTANIIYL